MPSVHNCALNTRLNPTQPPSSPPPPNVGPRAGERCLKACWAVQSSINHKWVVSGRGPPSTPSPPAPPTGYYCYDISPVVAQARNLASDYKDDDDRLHAHPKQPTLWESMRGQGRDRRPEATKLPTSLTCSNLPEFALLHIVYRFALVNDLIELWGVLKLKTTSPFFLSAISTPNGPVLRRWPVFVHQ